MPVPTLLALMLQTTALMPQTTPLPNAAWKERNQPEMPRLPPCALQDASVVMTLTALPEPLAVEIQRFFESIGGMSDAGGPYNSTDVIDGKVPRSRFLRAYRVGNAWIIWFEKGGFVSGPRTLAFRENKQVRAGERAYQAMPGTFFSGELCMATKAILAGVRSLPS